MLDTVLQCKVQPNLNNQLLFKVKYDLLRIVLVIVTREFVCGEKLPVPESGMLHHKPQKGLPSFL